MQLDIFSFQKASVMSQASRQRELDQNLDQKILSVGVFVNETIEKVTEIANEVPLDVIQLHGDEDVIYIEQLRQQTDKEIWKAVRVKDTKTSRKPNSFQLINCYWIHLQKEKICMEVPEK